MKIKLVISGLLMILVAEHCFAQKQVQNIGFYSIKSGPGKILEAYSLMPETNISWFTGFEFGQAAKGEHAWEKLLNYPEYGLEILYGNLNNDFLGNTFALQPFLRWKLREHNKPLEINFTAGLGFAYFTDKYHFFDNPENGLIGSQITNYTKGELEIGYRFPQWRIYASAGAFHFSNGHVNLPNIGANVPEAKIGITWYHGQSDIVRNIDYPPHDSTWSVSARLGFGAHAYGSTMKPFAGPVYPVISSAVALNKNLSAAYRISFGAVGGFYQAYHNFLLSEIKLSKQDAAVNASYMSLFFGQELMMGKIAVYGEFGVDMWKPFIRGYGDVFDIEEGFGGFIKSWNSNRLGIKYYLKEINQRGFNANIGVFIKANYAQAEFAECALEICF